MLKVLVLLGLVALLPPGAFGETFSEIDIMVPAVSQNLETGTMFGVAVRLNIKMIEPGTGEIFMNTRALAEMDMQGSARVAARVAGEIADEDLEDKDFLITLYSNSTIIGGPSAGAAMTVAICALLKELRLRTDVIMTGMISPDGAIGVVGGIPEKAQAAHEAGASHFLVPEGQAVSYNSTTYEDVNVTELALDRWNLTVLEVSDVREAITIFTGLDFPPRKVPTTPVAVELYQRYMRNQSSAELDTANVSLCLVREMLLDQGANLSGDLGDLLDSQLQMAEERLEDAWDAFGDSLYYVASSKAFQSRILTRTVANYVSYYSAPEDNRHGIIEGLWNDIEEEIQAAEVMIGDLDVRSVSGLQCLAAAESRAEEARERLDDSIYWYNLNQADIALEDAGYAMERAFTAFIWANTTRFFSIGYRTYTDDLREIAEDLYADAAILATYADLLYESVFGLPISFIAALIPDYAFIDPYPSLDRADAGMAQGSWAMSTFEALESQTRSGIAIEFINVLILAETEDDAARMLQAKANASEPEARIAIGDSRSAGVEPVVSVSRYEFSQDLSELATMSSLGEAVFGFEYATRVSKLSIPLLDLYRPRLEVDLKEGSLLFHEIPLTGTARDPNDDEMSLGVEIGNLSLGISVTSGPFSWPLPIGSVPDGNVTVVLNLSDGYLFDISSFEAVVDNHPPEIRLENVMNNTVYSAPLSPRISASDVIDPSPHLTIELDGEAFGLNQSVGEGWHILRIHAEDEAGWSREVEYTFAVDPSPPMIQLVTPAENGTWHHPPLTIWWRIDDEHTTPRGSWRLDGGDWRKGREHNSSLGKWEHESWLSTLLEAPEGGHLLELRVIDRAGNTAQSSLTLVLDATPPNLTISGVEDQGRYRSPVMVEIGASDGVDPDPVVIALLNGAPFAGGTEIGVGIHQLEVRLSDKAGNEADFSASFIVDTTPPTLWANISDGAAYARSVTIQHEASDDLGPLEYLSVTLDGKSYDGGMIPPGEHVFQMDASDSVGNSGGLRAEFLIDVTSPEISVSVGDRTWHTRPVELVVSVVDDLDSQPESEIMIDGQPLAAEPIGEGNHSLVAWARDSAGNFATLSTRFYVDTTAPTISIVGVADNRTYARSVVPKVTVSDTVDESPTVSMTLNGEPHLAGSRLLDGTYTLEVQARDGAGNEDRRSLTFVIDTVPPTIEVSIEEGAIYVGRVVPEIRAFDQRGSVSKEIILDGEPYDEGKAIGPGTHNLLVRARDVAGNVAEAKLVFTVKRGILQWVLLGVVFAFIAGAALLRTLRRRETRPQMYRFG